MVWCGEVRCGVVWCGGYKGISGFGNKVQEPSDIDSMLSELCSPDTRSSREQSQDDCLPRETRLSSALPLITLALRQECLHQAFGAKPCLTKAILKQYY